eukprot:SAG31_NODE_202_length_20512_cov_62.659237_1_plen_98_part_00
MPPSASAMNCAMFGNFSISALHLSIKVPYFSNSGHKNEKVTPYLLEILQKVPMLAAEHLFQQDVQLLAVDRLLRVQEQAVRDQIVKASCRERVRQYV